MYGTDTLNVKEEIPMAEMVKAKPDPNEAIEDIVSRMLNDFNVEEQKEILMATKDKLCRHYEELRQNHLKGAEDYARRIECLQK